MRIGRVVCATAVGVLLVSSGAWQALAASHQAAGKEQKADKPAAAETRRHVGTLKAVDSAAGTLTVTEKEGDATVSVGDKTPIKRGKDSVKLSDLKPGDEIVVRYVKEDSKGVARDVTVRPK